MENNTGLAAEAKAAEQKHIEQQRLAAEAKATQQKRIEEERLAAEAKAAEQKRIEEERFSQCYFPPHFFAESTDNFELAEKIPHVFRIG